ncbi:MAG: ABC transporter permease [Egibacteraceae bacterium]
MAISLAPDRAELVTRASREATWHGSGVPTQVLTLVKRSLRPLVLDPRMVLASLMGPLLMLLVFSQIFASVANTSSFPANVRYIDFLVPAIMVNSVMQFGLNTGAGLAQDMRNGIISRFRSLPIWLGSVLLARSFADLIRSGLQLLLLLMTAFLLFGFRPAGGVIGALGAWGLALVVGGGLGWIFIAIACWVRNAEMMQTFAGLVMFPLMFASNAFVPVSSLPGWLRTVAQLNPMSYGIDAARDLTLAQPVGGSAVAAVVISLLIAPMAAAVAIRGFRRPM